MFISDKSKFHLDQILTVGSVELSLYIQTIEFLNIEFIFIILASIDWVWSCRII